MLKKLITILLFLCSTNQLINSKKISVIGTGKFSDYIILDSIFDYYIQLDTDITEEYFKKFELEILDEENKVSKNNNFTIDVEEFKKNKEKNSILLHIYAGEVGYINIRIKENECFDSFYKAKICQVVATSPHISFVGDAPFNISYSKTFNKGKIEIISHEEDIEYIEMIVSFKNKKIANIICPKKKSSSKEIVELKAHIHQYHYFCIFNNENVPVLVDNSNGKHTPFYNVDFIGNFNEKIAVTKLYILDYIKPFEILDIDINNYCFNPNSKFSFKAKINQKYEPSIYFPLENDLKWIYISLIGENDIKNKIQLICEVIKGKNIVNELSLTCEIDQKNKNSMKINYNQNYYFQIDENLKETGFALKSTIFKNNRIIPKKNYRFNFANSSTAEKINYSENPLEYIDFIFFDKLESNNLPVVNIFDLLGTDNEKEMNCSIKDDYTLRCIIDKTIFPPGNEDKIFKVELLDSCENIVYSNYISISGLVKKENSNINSRKKTILDLNLIPLNYFVPIFFVLLLFAVLAIKYKRKNRVNQNIQEGEELISY